MEKLKELIKKLFGTTEGMDQLEALVEELMDTSAEERAAQYKKENAKLREQRRNLRAEIDELQAGGDAGNGRKGPDFVKLRELEEKVESLEAENQTLKHGLEKEQKAKETTLNQLTSERDTAKTKLNEYVLNAELAKLANEHKVFPELLDTFTNELMRAGAKLESGDDAKDTKVMVGEKPITDFVKEFIGTAKGKYFIPHGGRVVNGVVIDSGGGGGGNDEEHFDPTSKNFSLSKQAELMRTNRTRYDELAAKYHKQKK
jgi:chromosome segregation ATPase